MNAGEDVVAAAIREVDEETGIHISPEILRLKVVSLHHHVDTQTVWVSWIFRAELNTVQGKLRSSEEGTSEWMSLTKLEKEEKVFPPSREYFEHVLHDVPGILYTNSEWNNHQFVRTLSRTIVL